MCCVHTCVDQSSEGRLLPIKDPSFGTAPAAVRKPGQQWEGQRQTFIKPDGGMIASIPSCLRTKFPPD